MTPTSKIVFTDYYYPDNTEEIDILKRLGDIEIVGCTKIIEGRVKDEDKGLKYSEDVDAIITQFINAVASKVCTAIGSTSGQPTREEVDRFLAKHLQEE